MDEWMKLLQAEMVDATNRRRSMADQAAARQRDASDQDMRIVGAFIAGNLFASDDPERFAGLNTGIRVPTTVDHPGNPVGKVA